jgi:hypothetical protein
VLSKEILGRHQLEEAVTVAQAEFLPDISWSNKLVQWAIPRERREQARASGGWLHLWERIQRAYLGLENGGKIALEKLDQSLARHFWLVLFCKEWCGCDAEGKVLTSEAVLEKLIGYFGPSVAESLKCLATLAEREWFVSEALFRREVETAGGAHCNLFGICFTSAGYALLRCDTGTGQVIKSPMVCRVDGSISVEGLMFDSPADLARAKGEEGFAVRGHVQWAHSSPGRRQTVRMENEVARLADSYGPRDIANRQAATCSTKSLETSAPSARMALQLHLHLSSHPSSFLREVRQLFVDYNSYEWTALLRWTLQLPSSTKFAIDERNLIFKALRDLFIEAGRAFSRQLIDESFLPEDQQTLKPDPLFGGIAGGQKYQKGNQLFKFASDVKRGARWVYGGLESNHRVAMKSAGHEIKAIQALINTEITQLNFPLMAAYTYRGKRVLCVLLLPIRGEEGLWFA